MEMEIESISNSNAPQLVSYITIEADLESDKFVEQFPRHIYLFEDIQPVLHDKKEVKRLCTQSYYNHKGGCPNWAKKPGCPPRLPLLNEQYDIDSIYAIVARFPFKEYIDKKRALIHPDWNNRELVNQRHWQGHLRSLVFNYWDRVKGDFPNHKFIKNPEGQGVNLQESLKQVGIDLDWCVQDEKWNIIEIPEYMHYVCLMGKEL
jgi:hypothetical protein